MWQYNDYSELYHHGILGQKWGVRKGPPYPIENGRHSALEKRRAAEERAKRREAHAAERKERAEKRKAEKNENRLFTKKQKKIFAIGTAAVAGAMMLYRKKRKKEYRQYENAVGKFSRELGMKKLDDAGLKKKIERLKLEKEVIGLGVGKEKDYVNRGKVFVNGLLKEGSGSDISNEVIKRVATTAVTGAFLYGLKSLASGKADRKELGDAIFNGGAKKK